MASVLLRLVRVVGRLLYRSVVGRDEKDILF